MRILLLALISLTSFVAQAQIEFGLAAGLRSGQIETDLRNARTGTREGLQVGPLAYFPIWEIAGIRTGFLYTRRYAAIENTASGNVEIKYTYFDVPMTVMAKLSDMGGFFGGPVIAFNQSRDVSCSLKDCAAAEMKSIIFPLQIGASFRILPSVGAELYYEMVSGDLSANVSDMRTIGANFIYYFE